jgi:hypothetical protein
MDIGEKFRSAMALHQQGQLSPAQAIYDEILRVDPAHADALHLLGLIAYQQQQFARALELIGRAIAVNPLSAAFYANRGIVLQGLKQFDAAIADYGRAIAIKPDYTDAYNNRGLALHELKQPRAAMIDYDKAIAARPDFAQAYNNRGVALRELKQLDAAIADFDKAIVIKPGYAEAYWNKALTLLLRGDLESGFALYEWRWKNPNANMAPRPFAQPLWLGQEPLRDKTILLYSEQGLGDTIQFCRYAVLLAGAGAQVVVEAPQQLTSLLTSLAGVSRIVARGENLPDFDYHCPLMSLPLACKTRLDTIPDPTPYLQADPAKAHLWQGRIGERQKLNVGVVWSGGFRADASHIWTASNEERNIPLDSVARALGGVDADFFSLQKGDPAESEIRHHERDYWPRGNFHNFAGEIKDFADTAALVANLDLVISVDTATAHLAAAMGKPTWILNRFDSDWRWLLGRDDSPWYRSVTLYRQDESQDWEPVLRRVAADLTKRATAHSSEADIQP